MYDLDSQTEYTSCSSRTTQIVTSGGKSVVGDSLQGTTQLPITSPPVGKWITVLDIPIEVHARLLPTFCSSIVARQYSIILRVKVGGVRQVSFDLEVPLQVIHSSPDTPQSASLEPIREDQQGLEFRRSSATSCFSDETLASNLIFMIRVSWLISFRNLRASRRITTHKKHGYLIRGRPARMQVNNQGKEFS